MITRLQLIIVAIFEVDISNSCRGSIKNYLAKKKHTLALNAVSSSGKVTKFFKDNTLSSENVLIAAKEGTFAYQTINHMQSFRSLDCTSKLIATLFEPKCTLGRTQSEVIVKNVFAKEAQSRLNNALQKNNYFSVMVDSSNHREIKVVPLLVRYIDSDKGIQIPIVSKYIGLSADNTNTNFGGPNRQGKNNLFKKLTHSCSTSIVGVGCVVHILNNCIQNSTDVLPFDIEVIVVKIYKYFYIYTVRVSTLKTFCDSVEVEYKKMLSFSKTRFLSLMPAVERILQMFEPLKVYFESTECPTILKEFFENPVGEVWFWFIHNNSLLFHQAILKIEGDKISATEASLDKVKASLSKLQSLNPNEDVYDQFSLKAEKFYSSCINYLNKWSTNMNNIKLFSWICLHDLVTWNQITTSCETFKNSLGTNLNEDQLFDEIGHLKLYLTKEKLTDWNKNNISTEDRWLEFFRFMKGKLVPVPNLEKLCEFVLCLPGTSAPIERLFSHINKYWTSEKSQLEISSLKSIMQVYTNFDESCHKMFNMLKMDQKILKEIHGSQKYLK
ncbi:protein FAM200B-like [Aphis craccivora]|uniref:Protein FAM200B-like n=1 Tax=Aphis craccivora TaxID=307492 RepID=A0A6G0W1N0_APHCR|nr:protein FAM200B-like [Aphis craccivora]